MQNSLTQDFFSFFRLPRRFALDPQVLEEAWRTIIAQVHPDRYANASEAERRYALQLSTHANAAYQTLKFPLSRAHYLLQLAGVDTQEESNTQMPIEFLTAQMQWREMIANAKTAHDLNALETLSQALHQETYNLEHALGQALDEHPHLDNAALYVRKLRFFDKLKQEIGDTIEALLNPER